MLSFTLSNGLFLVTINIHVPCSMLLDSLASIEHTSLAFRDQIFYCFSPKSWLSTQCPTLFLTHLNEK